LASSWDIDFLFLLSSDRKSLCGTELACAPAVCMLTGAGSANSSFLTLASTVFFIFARPI
jgi:hypothetical protein